MEEKKGFAEAFEVRIKTIPVEIRRRLLESSQVTIFGSFSSNLNEAKSDLDVFCVGQTKTHYKSSVIEVMILPEYETYSDLWLGSELANHIKSYGVPLGQQLQWLDGAEISDSAVLRKARRVSGYLSSLTDRWHSLSPSFHARYELRLRRELQRLELLTQARPTPPTKLLDMKHEAISSQRSYLSLLKPIELDILLKLFPNWRS